MFQKLRSSLKATSTNVDIPEPAKYINTLQPIASSYTRSLGGSEPRGEHVAGNEHAASTTSSPGHTFNVLLCGETGVGKSSVINLIAQKEIAVVSLGINDYSIQYKRYDIPFDGVNFAIYETVALEGPRMDRNGYLKAIKQIYGLINRLSAAGGIHLLLFCLRGDKVTATTQSSYRLFRKCFCYGGVPIALVITGLEREAEMEDWWRKNKKDIEHYGIKSDGHACITAVRDDDNKFLVSQVRIRKLLKEYAIKRDPFSPETRPWFTRFTRGMSFIKGKKVPKERQIMKVLMQCCKLDLDIAREVATMMEKGDVETSKGEESRESSWGNEPWKKTGPEKNPRTLRSSPNERADPLADKFSDESALNGCDKEDSRSRNGDDEPEDGGGAVLGEPPKKDNSPPQEHEDMEAGDGKEPAKISIDESRSNRHDQKVQQAGIQGGEQTETGRVSTNGDSLLEKHRKEARLLRERQSSEERDDSNGAGTPTDESLSIDLTGRVTKSSHHPFASGGYGDIYRGIYHSDEGPINVAIRTTRVSLYHDRQLPGNMKRFRREVAVWQGLEHPNVLPFLGTIMDPSTNPVIPAMVCPLAENGPLTVYLVEKNDLTIARRLLLIDNVAHGLWYLHCQQIVHGNLSGSNVLIDGGGMACIADFGLSTLLTRLRGSTFATNHHANSALRWTAPELFDISDHDISPTTQSDVYSFGCIMLQILTGNIPYHYLSNDRQVIRAIVMGEKPTRPDSEVIDGNKWRFIERCWFPVTPAEPRPRPSGDQIVGFTQMALANTTKDSADADPVLDKEQGNRA